VDGITQTLHKKEMIEQMVEFLSFVLQTPVAGEFNFKFFIEKLAYLFGITSREIFIPEEEKQKAQQEAEQQAQMLGQTLAVLISSIEDEKAKTQFLRDLLKQGLIQPVIYAVQLLLQQKQQG